MRWKWLRFGIACCWAATLPWGCSPYEHSMSAASANPVSETPRLTVDQVAAELICDFPQCSRESLKDCTTCEYAIKYRAQIAAQLEQGKSKEDIVDWFGKTYGQQVLGNPRGWAAAGIPYLAALLGLVPLTIVLRSRKQNQKINVPSAMQNSPVAAPNEDPRVKEALENYKY